MKKQNRLSVMYIHRIDPRHDHKHTCAEKKTGRVFSSPRLKKRKTEKIHTAMQVPEADAY